MRTARQHTVAMNGIQVTFPWRVRSCGKDLKSLRPTPISPLESKQTNRNSRSEVLVVSSDRFRFMNAQCFLACVRENAKLSPPFVIPQLDRESSWPRVAPWEHAANQRQLCVRTDRDCEQ